MKKIAVVIRIIMRIVLVEIKDKVEVGRVVGTEDDVDFIWYT